MWQEGRQSVDPAALVDWNEKFKTELVGELDEAEARKTLGKFIQFNIGFAVKILTGITLADYQRIVLKGWFSKGFIINVAGRGCGKCIQKNAIVLTESGFKEIKDVLVGEKIWAETGFEEIEAKCLNPLEDGFNVKTSKGYTCEGKIGHKLKVLNSDTFDFEWINTEDLNGSEIVPIKHSMNQFGGSTLSSDIDLSSRYSWEKYITINDNVDMAYFLGVLLGDGSIDLKNNSFNITNEDGEIKEFTRNFIKANLPNSKIREYARNDENKNLVSIGTSSSKFLKYLESIGVNLNQMGINKKIPSRILECNKDYISNFISGLFDTDGYASHRYDRDKNKHNLEIGYTSSSYELIKKVHSILLNFGIVSTLTKIYNGKVGETICGNLCDTHDSWSITIRDFKNIKKFKECIGFRIKRKLDKIDIYLNNKAKDTDYGYSLVPNIGRYIKLKYGNEFRRITGVKMFDSLSISRLQEVLDSGFLDAEDSAKVLNIISSDFVYDSIKTIDPVKTETIDIQVANQKCYWSDGFINHNSTLASIFAYLYCLYNPNAHIIMVSATFRSSRRIVETIDEWSKRKEGALLQHTFQGDMTKKQDLYRITFKNGAKVTAVPLGDSNKLRGFRCNVLMIDEGLLIPQQTIDEVLKPFLIAGADITEKQRIRERENELIAKGRMEESDRMVFKSDSKMIILSSASYKWEHLYEIYKSYLKMIQMTEEEGGDEDSPASYLVQQYSYEIVPDELLDPALIKDIESGNTPQATMDREYKAIFTDGSDGYFSAKKMEDCTIADGMTPTIEIVGEDGSDYILAIDPNVSASASSDHFAIVVLKIVEKENGRRVPMMVHGYAAAGVELKYHILYFIYLLKHFNVVYIATDATQGSGIDFINICNESELFKKIKMKLLPIDAEFGKQDVETMAKQVKKSYNLENKQIVQKQVFHSDFQRAANEYLKASFDFKKILFAGSALAVDGLTSTLAEQDIGDIYDVHPHFKGEGLFEFIRHQDEIIKLTKKECAVIEPKMSQLGNVSFDMPQNIRRSKGIHRPRKDLYSALFLGNWAFKIYEESRTMPAEQKSFGFTPTLI